MTRITYILTLLLCSNVSNLIGQTITSYQASNGITYHIGDTITLNKGSYPDGMFRYIQTKGALASLIDSDGDTRVSQNSENAKTFLKKIKTVKNKLTFETETFFTLSTPGNVKILLSCDIEKAIETCEITPCNQD